MPRNIGIAQRSYAFDKEPDECPLCHFSIEPKELNTSIWSIRDIPVGLEIFHQCPRASCGRVFISRYRINNDRGILRFLESVPVAPRRPSIPQEVLDISPDFEKIYTQATAAEDHQLDQIAGVGYRKALEFLIKDYCIKNNPSHVKGIKNKFLGKCIDEHVDDERVKKCAKRATWLGNDETHYVRKWEDKDIEDLKTLIRLTMNWIQSDVLTEAYEEDMP